MCNYELKNDSAFGLSIVRAYFSINISINNKTLNLVYFAHGLPFSYSRFHMDFRFLEILTAVRGSD